MEQKDYVCTSFVHHSFSFGEWETPPTLSFLPLSSVILLLSPHSYGEGKRKRKERGKRIE
jgi:hypothetical protein